MKFLNRVCLICTVFFFSCSQTLDFDQINEYTTSPSFSTPLIFFSISPNDFTAPLGNPLTTEISDHTDFKLFENKIIKSNLVKLDFNIKIRNEINRDFTLEINLLNESNALIYRLNDLKINANNLDFKQLESIDVRLNPNVKNFTRVQIKLSLDDKTTPINASDIGNFELKSAATVYLENSL